MGEMVKFMVCIVTTTEKKKKEFSPTFCHVLRRTPEGCSWLIPGFLCLENRRHAGFWAAQRPACRGRDFSVSPHLEVYVTPLRSHWTEAQGARVSQSPMWGHSSALKGEENSSILHPLLLPLLAQWANIRKEPGALLRRVLYKYSLFLLIGTPGVTVRSPEWFRWGTVPGGLKFSPSTSAQVTGCRSPKHCPQEEPSREYCLFFVTWELPLIPVTAEEHSELLWGFGYRVYIFCEQLWRHLPRSLL